MLLVKTTLHDVRTRVPPSRTYTKCPLRSVSWPIKVPRSPQAKLEPRAALERLKLDNHGLSECTKVAHVQWVAVEAFIRGGGEENSGEHTVVRVRRGANRVFPEVV